MQAEYEGAQVAQRATVAAAGPDNTPSRRRPRAMQAEQAHHAEQHRIIVEQFPEYADPTTGPKLQQELSAVARELGYPPELIGQARAPTSSPCGQAASGRRKPPNTTP
jgi:hypothetical protein